MAGFAWPAALDAQLGAELARTGRPRRGWNKSWPQGIAPRVGRTEGAVKERARKLGLHPLQLVGAVVGREPGIACTHCGWCATWLQLGVEVAALVERLRTVCAEHVRCPQGGKS